MLWLDLLRRRVTHDEWVASRYSCLPCPSLAAPSWDYSGMIATYGCSGETSPLLFLLCMQISEHIDARYHWCCKKEWQFVHAID